MINCSSVKPSCQQESINNVHLLLLWPHLSGLQHNNVFADVLSECPASYFITFKLDRISHWKSQFSPQILTAFPVKLSFQVFPPKIMQLSSDRSLQWSYECNDMLNQILHEARHIICFKSQYILQSTSMRYKKKIYFFLKLNKKHK